MACTEPNDPEAQKDRNHRGINSGGPQNLTMTEVLNADGFAYTGEVLSG